MYTEVSCGTQNRMKQKVLLTQNDQQIFKGGVVDTLFVFLAAAIPHICPNADCVLSFDIFVTKVSA